MSTPSKFGFGDSGIARGMFVSETFVKSQMDERAMICYYRITPVALKLKTHGH